jgi:hypothetical protein
MFFCVPQVHDRFPKNEHEFNEFFNQLEAPAERFLGLFSFFFYIQRKIREVMVISTFKTRFIEFSHRKMIECVDKLYNQRLISIKLSKDLKKQITESDKRIQLYVIGTGIFAIFHFILDLPSVIVAGGLAVIGKLWMAVLLLLIGITLRVSTVLILMCVENFKNLTIALQWAWIPIFGNFAFVFQALNKGITKLSLLIMWIIIVIVTASKLYLTTFYFILSLVLGLTIFLIVEFFELRKQASREDNLPI